MGIMLDIAQEIYKINKENVKECHIDAEEVI